MNIFTGENTTVVSGDVLPSVPGVDLGSSTSPFGTVYAESAEVKDVNMTGTLEVKDVIINGEIIGSIVPALDDTYDIGTPAKRYKTHHVTTVEADTMTVDTQFESKGTTIGISHLDLTNKGTNTHAQIDTHLGDATIHFTQSAIDHVNLQNIGTNTHAQIDTTLLSQGANISALITRTQHQSANATTTTIGGSGGLVVTNGLTSASLNTGSAAIGGSATVGGAMTVAGFPVATSNDLAPINTNLTTLNTKTQHQTADATTTTFAGSTGVTINGGIRCDNHNGRTNPAMSLVFIDGQGVRADTIPAIFPLADGGVTFGRSGQRSSVVYTQVLEANNRIDLQGTNTYRMRTSPADFILERTGLGTILNWNASTFNIQTPVVRGFYVGPGNRPVVSSGFVQTVAGPTLASSTTQTILNSTGIGTLTIPANTIIVGSTSLIRVGGLLQTNANNTVFTLRLKRGAGGIADPDFISLPFTIQTVTAGAVGWYQEFLFTCRTAGAGGLFAASVRGTMDLQPTNFSSFNIPLDTTIANTFNITGQFVVSSPLNNITIHQMVSSNLYQPLA